MADFQSILDEAFPASTDSAVVRCVAQAVLLAADVMKHEAFLDSLIGGDIRGHIRRAAVLFSMHSSCKAGDLPFSSTMTRMPLGGGHWVELRSGPFRAHICRTEGAAAFPEDTPTRQDQRLTNQIEMRFDDKVVPIRPEPDLNDLYAWMTFNADGPNLTHLCWGMPEAGKNVWLARSNVIRRLGSLDITPADVPANPVRLRFREHIEEALRREDDQSDLTS